MKKNNKSKICGIIGIILGILSPIVGIILGTIGLSITKQEGKEDRDKILNIVAIGVSIFMWMVNLVLIL